MLSLPLIFPRDDHTLWPLQPTHTLPHRPSSPPSSHPQNQPPGPNSPPTSPHHVRARPLTALSALQADEATFAARKLNIARFGATWIRPPGVPKTYQAAMDEAVEREEQEALARREQVMMELAQAQEMAEEEGRRREMVRRAEEGEDVVEEEEDLDADVPDLDAGVVDMDEAGSGFEEDELDEDELEEDEGEDLDAEVPEGSALGGSMSGSEEEDEDASVSVSNIHEDADVTFNEESMYNDNSLLSPPSYPSPHPHADTENTYASPNATRTYLARQEAELSGALQDERDLGPDLDDDVPEADEVSYLDGRSYMEGGSYIEGSYQHTDTELESDNDDDPDGSSSFVSTGPGAALNLRASMVRMQARTNAAAAASAAAAATGLPHTSVLDADAEAETASPAPRPGPTGRRLDFALNTPPIPPPHAQAAPGFNLSRLDLNRRPRDSIDTEGQSSFQLGDASSFLASSPAMGRGAGGAGAGGATRLDAGEGAPWLRTAPGAGARRRAGPGAWRRGG